MSLDPKSAGNEGELNKGDVGAAQGEAQKPDKGSIQDSELEGVLRDFRLSVHAWSDRVYHRPRLLADTAPRRTSWRKAAAWSLGCVLTAGVVGGGLLEHRHREELARIAAAHEAQHQRQLAEERARQAADELAKVDSDVAREVPNAMEPLAQLMAEDESQ